MNQPNQPQNRSTIHGANFPTHSPTDGSKPGGRNAVVSVLSVGVGESFP